MSKLTRCAVAVAALLLIGGSASALPGAAPTTAPASDAILVKGGHGHGHGHARGHRGRHLGWVIGRHRGWAHSRHHRHW
jgi:hypothetical protein